ncbi:MAG: metalloregulator ArsR/SmtB family transcription factor [Actinomycetota bacterium]|nr:metalloregulator ArsR/SmtB family transcription factor [Actinomycetota bacterium]
MTIEIDEARLDTVFMALASQPRRAILKRLSSGSAPIAELVRLVGLTQPAVSKHLKVLESAGLLTRARRAQFRPSELDLAPILEVEAWVSGFTHQWEERLNRLGALIDGDRLDLPLRLHSEGIEAEAVSDPEDEGRK